MNKTWKPIDFSPVFEIKKDRIVGLTFPVQNTTLGLEPSILTVLPDGNNVEYSLENHQFNDSSILFIFVLFISREWTNLKNGLIVTIKQKLSLEVIILQCFLKNLRITLLKLC